MNGSGNVINLLDYQRATLAAMADQQMAMMVASVATLLWLIMLAAMADQQMAMMEYLPRVAPARVPEYLTLADRHAEELARLAIRVAEPSDGGAPRLTAAHRCHLPICQTPTPRAYLFCPRHWRLVPREIRARVWVAYANLPHRGDGSCARVSRDYLGAVKAAQDAVRAALQNEGA